MPLSELKNVRIVKIGPDNMSQAQSIFCDAYEDNEFTRYMFNADGRGYKQRLRGFIREELLLHFSHSNISVALALDDRLIGAAMVNRVDIPLNIANSWRWRMGMYSVAGIRNTERLRRYYKSIQGILINKEYYWISLMGLHHDFQHHGFGHALIEAVHRECERDPQYKGIAVDSIDEQYKYFFKSLGYKKEGSFEVDQMTMDVLFHSRDDLLLSPLSSTAAETVNAV